MKNNFFKLYYENNKLVVFILPFYFLISYISFAYWNFPNEKGNELLKFIFTNLLVIISISVSISIAMINFNRKEFLLSNTSLIARLRFFSISFLIFIFISFIAYFTDSTLIFGKNFFFALIFSGIFFIFSLFIDILGTIIKQLNPVEILKELLKEDNFEEVESFLKQLLVNENERILKLSLKEINDFHFKNFKYRNTKNLIKIYTELLDYCKLNNNHKKFMLLIKYLEPFLTHLIKKTSSLDLEKRGDFASNLFEVMDVDFYEFIHNYEKPDYLWEYSTFLSNILDLIAKARNNLYYHFIIDFTVYFFRELDKKSIKVSEVFLRHFLGEINLSFLKKTFQGVYSLNAKIIKEVFPYIRKYNYTEEELYILPDLVKEYSLQMPKIIDLYDKEWFSEDLNCLFDFNLHFINLLYHKKITHEFEEQVGIYINLLNKIKSTNFEKKEFTITRLVWKFEDLAIIQLRSLGLYHLDDINSFLKLLNKNQRSDFFERYSERFTDYIFNRKYIENYFLSKRMPRGEFLEKFQQEFIYIKELAPYIIKYLKKENKESSQIENWIKKILS